MKVEEIVFADDNNDNLEGARQLGIQIFFYNGFDNFVSNLKDLGVRID